MLFLFSRTVSFLQSFFYISATVDGSSPDHNCEIRNFLFSNLAFSKCLYCILPVKNSLCMFKESVVAPAPLLCVGW